MFFFFVCGEKTFQSDVEGFEGVVCQCHNCGNMSGHVVKRRPFFTFCWIVRFLSFITFLLFRLQLLTQTQPLIPFTISGYKDISCHICRFNEPLERRPDVQSMQNGGGGAAAPQQQYQGYPQQQPVPQQGWGPKPQGQDGGRYA